MAFAHLMRAGLGLGGEEQGATLTTGTFTAAANDTLAFLFNHITSDGADFADHAFVQLAGGPDVVTLFTARTTPTGNTVPGFGMPAISPGVTLDPATVTIVPGPAALGLFGLGLLGLAAARRR